MLHSNTLQTASLVRDNYDFQQRSMLIMASTGRTDSEKLGESIASLHKDRAAALRDIYFGSDDHPQDSSPKPTGPGTPEVVSAMSSVGRTAFSSLAELQDTMLQMQDTLRELDAHEEPLNDHS